MRIHSRAWTVTVAMACLTVLVGCGHTSYSPPIETTPVTPTTMTKNSTDSNTSHSATSNATPSNNTSSTHSSNTTTSPVYVNSPPAQQQSGAGWSDPTNLPGITHWDTSNYKSTATKRLVPEIYSVPAGSVALTIDDGPSPYTRQIIDTLNKYHAHVTFFDVAQNVQRDPSVVKYAVESGDLVEDHSMTHPDFFTISPQAQYNQITQAAHIIEQVTHQPVRLFRPPYEAFDNVTEQILQHDGMSLALWNRDPRDWAAKSSSEIVNAVLNGNPSGSVFDLHDKKLTMEALPAILQGLAKRHLKLVVLPTPDLKQASSVSVTTNDTSTKSSRSTKPGNQTTNTTNATGHVTGNTVGSTGNQTANNTRNVASNNTTAASNRTVNSTGNRTATVKSSPATTNNTTTNTTTKSHANTTSNPSDNNTVTVAPANNSTVSNGAS